MVDRKIYSSLDIMKFIMAMLILTQHTSNEWAHSTGLVHDFFGLGNFAVPFFFACSGFLFFSKLNCLGSDEQYNYYKKWSFRLGKMYLVWSLIYFCFVLVKWIGQGLSLEQFERYFHRALVFSTYATIWFLPALWVGVSVCYWLKKHVSYRTFWIIIMILLIIGNLFGSYSNVMIKHPSIASFYNLYMDIFITWRNGLFNGAPYVFIGILLSEGYGKTISRNISIIATSVFAVLFLAEAFAITRLKLSSATDMGFMMYPAIFFMMNTLINTSIQQKTLWTYCRNLSMLIFLGQRLFLSAIPGILPLGISEAIMEWPELCIYLFFVSIVFVFSVIIVQLSAKYSFFKILW